MQKFILFLAIFLSVSAISGHAQESALSGIERDYGESDSLSSQYDALLDKLKTAAERLQDITASAESSITELHNEIDRITPDSSTTCDPKTEKYLWDGNKWICGDDLSEELIWTTGSWGGCSRLCNGGTQSRTTQCKMKLSNKNVASQYCIYSPQPPTSQSCNTQRCPSWNVGGWSGCSNSCGSGTQSRSVSCPTADAFCATGSSRPSSV